MSATAGWVARINSFAGRGATPARCDLCGAPLASGHPHLVEAQPYRILCACTSCAILFDHAAGARFRRVPTHAGLLDFDLTDELWNDLRVPIDIAFFYQSSAHGRPIGLYPGAAGVIQADLDADAWSRLEQASPALAALSPDVEALLVNRLHGARECYRMPIDRCFALAGVIRRYWRGFSGGTEVWREVQRYFDELRRELHSTAAAAGAAYARA